MSEQLKRMTRRHFFQQTGFGIGSLALGSLLNENLFAGQGLHQLDLLGRLRLLLAHPRGPAFGRLRPFLSRLFLLGRFLRQAARDRGLGRGFLGDGRRARELLGLSLGLRRFGRGSGSGGVETRQHIVRLGTHRRLQLERGGL